MQYFFEPATGDYHLVTKESPRNFKGVLFVGQGPPLGSGLGIDGISEQVYPAHLLGTKLVPASHVPDAWRFAYGEEPEPVIVDDTVVDIMPAGIPRSKTVAKFDQTWYAIGMLASIILYWLIS